MGLAQLDKNGDIGPHLAGSGAGMSIGGAVTTGTQGSVLYVGSGGVLAQDNANFFYDDTDHQLVMAAGTAAKPPYSLVDDGLGLYRQAANSLGVTTAGVARWHVNASGHLLATTDASFDIGASGANRPRSGFFSGGITTGANVTFGSLLANLITRGAPNRAGIEAASANYTYLVGNLTAGSTTDCDVILGSGTNKSAGRTFCVSKNMSTGGIGTRLFTIMFDSRANIGVPASAPTDADLQASEVSFYLDEVGNALKARVKYADGTTLKTGTVALL